MKKQKLLALLLAGVLVLGFASACTGKGNETDTTGGVEESTTEAQTEAVTEAPPVKLSSLKLGGVEISEFQIVFDKSFTRIDCYEDYETYAKSFAAELEELTGKKLAVVSDSTSAAEHEIILGFASRAICTENYGSGKLDEDDVVVKYADGNLLLGATCLAGVRDACELLLEHIVTEAREGNKTEIALPETFDISTAQHVTRIVCVGDSITQGVGSSFDIYCSYPTKLQANLGTEYDVINLGWSGATMCSSNAVPELYPARSYINKSGYYDDLMAVAEKTDIVVIMLGTNDAGGTTPITNLLKNNMNTFKNDYKGNLSKMVNDLRAKNADIEIVLFNAPVSYRAAGEANYVAYLRPYQKEVAAELGIKFYDIYTHTKENMPSSDYPDGLHPNDAGYVKLAQGAEKGLRELFDLK